MKWHGHWLVAQTVCFRFRTQPLRDYRSPPLHLFTAKATGWQRLLFGPHFTQRPTLCCLKALVMSWFTWNVNTSTLPLCSALRYELCCPEISSKWTKPQSQVTVPIWLDQNRNVGLSKMNDVWGWGIDAASSQWNSSLCIPNRTLGILSGLWAKSTWQQSSTNIFGEHFQHGASTDSATIHNKEPYAHIWWSIFGMFKNFPLSNLIKSWLNWFLRVLELL